MPQHLLENLLERLRRDQAAVYLGSRRIRSAGRASGSIEITLPVALEVLEGVECRLMMRDGPQPEIVLLPDTAPAQVLFYDMWQELRLGLSEIADIGEFSLADFSLAFFPPHPWLERPPLAYADALAALQEETRAEHQYPATRPRLLAGLAVAAAHRLGLIGSLALGFGESIAFLVTGTAVGLGSDFERAAAHCAFWADGEAQPLDPARDEAVWQQTQPGLRRVYEQFRVWQEHPEAYAAARDRWYRAVAVEAGVPVPFVDEELQERQAVHR